MNRRHRHAAEADLHLPSAEKGFTIIELLVVLFLTAFILTFTFGGFRLGMRVWESSAAASQNVYRLQALHRVMGDMLFRAFPLNEQTGEDARVLFEGRRDRIVFAASLPPRPSSGGLHIVTFRIVADRGRNRLHIARVPYAPGADRILDDPEYTEVIFDGVVDMTFSYLGGQGETNGEWVENWDSEVSLPSLIRISFAGTSTSAPVWPDMTFPVAINAEAACFVPDIPGHCRWREKDQ